MHNNERNATEIIEGKGMVIIDAGEDCLHRIQNAGHQNTGTKANRDS